MKNEKCWSGVEVLCNGGVIGKELKIKELRKVNL